VGCKSGTSDANGVTADGVASSTAALSGSLSGGAVPSNSAADRTLAAARSGPPTSCNALAPSCGPTGNDDCCKTLPVPGGTFDRNYDGVDFLGPRSPATVTDFAFDKYEVTVSRFRAFVNSGMGTQESPPQEGAGAHPKVAGSGWRSSWNEALSLDAAALKAGLKCNATYQTWTDAPADEESKPMNCVDWYTAFAFCAWDGGRLPTEAEWSYAAFGGSEQRYYPWSSPPNSTVIDDSYAAYCGGTCKVLNVGSKSPKGDAKWGQADLGGNAWEWTLDSGAGAYPMPCNDCAEVAEGKYRAFRSGSNDDIAATLRSAVRHLYYPTYHGVVGVRCARNR
jgi:formylglycine-generating enzyme